MCLRVAFAAVFWRGDVLFENRESARSNPRPGRGGGSMSENVRKCPI
jgi:hypothetical protein